jgi:hypothetical protein
MKNRFQSFPFNFQLAALQLGGGGRVRLHHQSRQGGAAARVVALQVDFEGQTLKPVFFLIGYRLRV